VYVSKTRLHAVPQVYPVQLKGDLYMLSRAESVMAA
jgi:hypothetical protein